MIVARSCEHENECWLHEGKGFSGLPEQILSSKQGLYSMELVIGFLLFNAVKF